MQRSLITFRSSSSGSSSPTSPYLFGAFFSLSKAHGSAPHSTIPKDIKARNKGKGKEVDTQPPPRPDDSGSDGDNESESEDESDRESSPEYYPNTAGQGNDRSPPHVSNQDESTVLDMTGPAYRTVRPNTGQRRDLVGWRKIFDDPMPKKEKGKAQLFAPSSSRAAHSDRPCRMYAPSSAHLGGVQKPKAKCKPARGVAGSRGAGGKSAESRQNHVAAEASQKGGNTGPKVECLITDCESCGATVDHKEKKDKKDKGKGKECDRRNNGGDLKRPSNPQQGGLMETKKRNEGPSRQKAKRITNGQNDRCQRVMPVDGPSSAAIEGQAQVKSIDFDQSNCRNEVLPTPPPGSVIPWPLIEVENGLVLSDPKSKDKKRKLEAGIDGAHSGHQAEPARKRWAAVRTVHSRGKSSTSAITTIEGPEHGPQSVPIFHQVQKTTPPLSLGECSIITEAHAPLGQSSNGDNCQKKPVTKVTDQLPKGGILRGPGYHIIEGGYANAGYPGYKPSSTRKAKGVTISNEVQRTAPPPSLGGCSIITEAHAPLGQSSNGDNCQKKPVTQLTDQLPKGGILRGPGYHIIEGGYANAGYPGYKPPSTRKAVAEPKEPSNPTSINNGARRSRNKFFAVRRQAL